MNTIQQLRAQAVAAGNLVDTPQQKIVKEETCIRIVPAEPDVITCHSMIRKLSSGAYEPYGTYLAPVLTFGLALRSAPGSTTMRLAAA